MDELEAAGAARTHPDFFVAVAVCMTTPQTVALLLAAFLGAACSSTIPCCDDDDPEKERVARFCLAHTEAGVKCDNSEYQKLCPITCGVCMICPDHPRFDSLRRIGTLHRTSFTMPKPSERSTSDGEAEDAPRSLRAAGDNQRGVVASGLHNGAYLPTLANQSQRTLAEAFIGRGPSDVCVYYAKNAREVIKSNGTEPIKQAAKCRKRTAWSDHDVRNYIQSFWHPGAPHGASCGLMSRLGEGGDGGKFVCDPDAIVRAGPSCLVVSIGSNGDPSFERAVYDLNPECTIHTYDHTLNPLKRSRLLVSMPSTNLPAICVDGRCPPKLPGGMPRAWSNPEQTRWKKANATWGDAQRVLTLFEEPFEATQQQLRRYTGRTVHVLKMDCDGCEFKALPRWLNGKGRTRGICTDQILFELHASSAPGVWGRGGTIPGSGNASQRLLYTHALMSTLEESFAVFAFEPNIAFSDGACAEYGLIRRNGRGFDCSS